MITPDGVSSCSSTPRHRLDIFFGANFLFLPILFVLVLPLNAITSRIRPPLTEMALIIAALGLYLFTNAAPDYVAAWQLRGTWIERIYQPVFPALLLVCARWYQHLPPVGRALRFGIFSVVGLAMAGNALIIFGPILDNPLGISELAFYRFYDHANHVNYELNLAKFGRRPLGFPRPQARAMRVSVMKAWMAPSWSARYPLTGEARDGKFDWPTPAFAFTFTPSP